MNQETRSALQVLYSKMNGVRNDTNGYYALRSIVNDMISKLENDSSLILISNLKHNLSELNKFKANDSQARKDEIINSFKDHVERDLTRAGVFQ